VGLIVPRIGAALDMSARAAVFTGPHIHEQRKPDALGGIYCPAASARHCWGFKSFLPILLYGQRPAYQGSRHTVLSSNETVDRGTINHPVPKPVGWMLWLLALASLPDEVVLDPFCGSGTTGVASLRTGRRFIGIEKCAQYASLARERMAAEESGSTLRARRAGQLALLGKETA
jgi:hypothetical protein